MDWLDDCMVVAHTFGLWWVWGFLISVATIFLIAFYIKKLIELHTNRENCITLDLSQHSFFLRMQYFLDFKINRLDFGCPVRNQMFRDLLQTKFIFWKNAAVDICDIQACCDDELIRKITARLYNAVTGYEAQWSQCGIPDVVIEKFNQWHQARFEYMVSTVTIIISSNFFDSHQEKIADILYTFTSLLSITVIDAEKVLSELNGDLTGIEYKGKIIGSGKSW